MALKKGPNYIARMKVPYRELLQMFQMPGSEFGDAAKVRYVLAHDDANRRVESRSGTRTLRSIATISPMVGDFRYSASRDFPTSISTPASRLP